MFCLFLPDTNMPACMVSTKYPTSFQTPFLDSEPPFENLPTWGLSNASYLAGNLAITL